MGGTTSIYSLKVDKQTSKNGKPTKGGEQTRASRFESAGILASYTLVFLLSYIKKAWQNELNLESLDKPAKADESAVLGERLAKHYLKELETSKQPSFARALFKTFAFQLLAASVFNTLARSLFFPLQVVSLGWLIRSIGDYSTLKTLCSRAVENVFATPAACSGFSTEWTLEQELDRVHRDVLKYAAVQFSALVLAVCSLHPYFFKTTHLGMKCRIAACHLIYSKALRLSQSSLKHATAGQMVNLLSNDVNRFDHTIQFIAFVFDAPLQTIVIVFLLVFFYLGLYPTLAGLLTILVFLFVQSSAANWIGRNRARTSLRTDKRLQLLSELVHAIQVVKMYAWEESFKSIINRARQSEMGQIKWAAALKAFNHTLFFASSKFVVFTMLLVYMLVGGELKPEIVFVSIGLCNMMQISVNLQLNNAIICCSETLVSCSRINKFLMLAEHNSGDSKRRLVLSSAAAPPKPGLPAIRMERLSANWPKDDEQKKTNVFQDLNLEIKQNELVFVVGRVGSGKSSVFLSILGELPLSSGRLEANGRVSYASQEAWIFYGTVRENILLGKEFHLQRYDQVVRACALERDLQLLVAGDQTIVGERGVSLSGGQRARVNLARALYEEADIYLLDDPLSAVDAPVAEHIFNEVVIKFLRNKTVLLATHQLQFLRHAKKVLLLEGTSECRQPLNAFGTLNQLVNQSSTFEEINFGVNSFKEALAASQQQTKTAQLSVVGPIRELCAGKAKKLGAVVHSTSLRLKATHPKPPSVRESVAGRNGSSRSAYSDYFGNAFGFVSALFVVGMFVFSCIMNQLVEYYVSLWTDSYVRRQLAEASQSLFRRVSFLDNLNHVEVVEYYALLVAIAFVAVLLLLGAYMNAALRASKQLHEKLLNGLLRAKMSFYDSTSIGVILNRCGRDLGFVDQHLPHRSVETLVVMISCLSSLALTVFLVPTNAFVSIVFLALALTIRTIALRTVLRLKHLEGISRTPVFAHLSASLDGVATIRAFKVESDFERKFDEQQDVHSTAYFAFMSMCLWTVRCMDWLGLFVVGLIVSAGVSQTSIETLGASLIGLLIAQSVYLPGLFAVTIRSIVEVESQLTSVQRVAELGKLDCEQQEDNFENNVVVDKNKQVSTENGDAQQTGELRFANVSLRYAPNKPPVLRELSFVIKPREKVGVVGRTGAGKSSLVAVLYRLYDFEGRVELDQQNTKSMSLKELRRKISIIPQEPVLFCGSLRRNLDPFDEHSDDELWAALDAVQLKRLINNSANTSDNSSSFGLESELEEGGSNFSVGQRQLICLARAIVRRNKILVLDEATANVDEETDSLIQRTILKQFAECTVITIAHRLETIANSDRVLVLDGGKLREFDEPRQLLQRGAKQSLFAQMVEGSAQKAPELRRLIEAAHSLREAAS